MDTQMPPQSAPNAPSHNFLKQVEEFFDTYLHKKVPFHLPPNVKEWIVKYGPWITLVLMIIAIPVILVALGITAFMGSVNIMYGGYAHTGYYISGGMRVHGLIALASLVIEAAALPGLFARSIKGWHLLYYAVLVGAIGILLGGDIIGFVFNLAISMYFLFQIREYYK